MKKIYWTAVIVAVLAVGAFAAAKIKKNLTSQTAKTAGTEQGQKINVVASFFPLYDFAKNVGGDFAQVTSITPAGAEPHDYEPTPRDIAKVYDAKLFIMNGNGVDAWAKKSRATWKAKVWWW